MLEPFNPTKAAIVHVAGVSLLALVGMRHVLSRARPPMRWNAVDLAVFAWVVANALSAAFGLSPRLSLIGEIEQREGLLTTVGLAGLYVGARASHHGDGDLRGTLFWIIGAVALASTYAMLQVAGLDPIAWANPEVYPGASANVLRPSGTLGNPILLGAIAATAVALVTAELGRSRRHAWLLLPLIALLGVAVVATLSRGAWIAAAAGVGCAVLGAASLSSPRRWRSVIALAGTVAVVPLLWAALVVRGPALARLAEGTSTAGSSMNARAEIAASVFAIVRERPWLGVGPDAFGLAFPGVQTSAFMQKAWIGMPVHAHSAALQILATGGIATALAGAFWLLALAWSLRAAWRASPRNRWTMLAVGAAILTLCIAGAVNVVGLAGASVFVVLSALVAATATESERPGATARRWALPIGTVVAVTLAWGESYGLRALDAAGRAHRVLEASAEAMTVPRHLFEVAATSANEAAGLAPWEDELWRLLADCDLALARSRLADADTAAANVAAAHAESASRQGLGLEPARAANTQRLAAAFAMLARCDAPNRNAFADSAHATYRRGEAQAPVEPLLRVEHVRAMLELGRAGAALQTATDVVRLYPDIATGHALVAAAQLALDRPADALASLRRAQSAQWEDGSERERRAVDAMAEQLQSSLRSGPSSQ